MESKAKKSRFKLFVNPQLEGWVETLQSSVAGLARGLESASKAVDALAQNIADVSAKASRNEEALGRLGSEIGSWNDASDAFAGRVDDNFHKLSLRISDASQCSARVDYKASRNEETLKRLQSSFDGLARGIESASKAVDALAQNIADVSDKASRNEETLERLDLDMGDIKRRLNSLERRAKSG